MSSYGWIPFLSDSLEAILPDAPSSSAAVNTLIRKSQSYDPSNHEAVYPVNVFRSKDADSTEMHLRIDPEASFYDSEHEVDIVSNGSVYSYIINVGRLGLFSIRNVDKDAEGTEVDRSLKKCVYYKIKELLHKDTHHEPHQNNSSKKDQGDLEMMRLTHDMDIDTAKREIALGFQRVCQNNLEALHSVQLQFRICNTLVDEAVNMQLDMRHLKQRFKAIGNGEFDFGPLNSFVKKFFNTHYPYWMMRKIPKMVDETFSDMVRTQYEAMNSHYVASMGCITYGLNYCRINGDDEVIAKCADSLMFYKSAIEAVYSSKTDVENYRQGKNSERFAIASQKSARSMNLLTAAVAVFTIVSFIITCLR